MSKITYHSFFVAVALSTVAVPFGVFGHAESEPLTVVGILGTLFIYDPLFVAGLALAVLLIAVFAVITLKPQGSTPKKLAFCLIVIPAVLASVYITSDTIYVIRASFTKGPVHWHADYRVFSCGKELDLVAPKGFSNRIGTPSLHEHNDNRIHLEGIPKSADEATLHEFFEVIGGTLAEDEMTFPATGGLVTMRNGDICSSGGTGELQAYLWETVNPEAPKGAWSARQKKLSDFTHYGYKPYGLIPPGDCVIFEFGTARTFTDKICEQYEVAEKRGDITIKRTESSF